AGPSGQPGQPAAKGPDGRPGVSAGSTTFDTAVPGLVGGTVFLDVNANGAREPGETALSGQVVYLDLNNNGRLDPGEPSAVTDASGVFTLSGVVAGTYTLRVQPFPGDAVTGPGSDTAVVLGGGLTLTGANLGLQTGSSIVPVYPSTAPFG